MNEEPKTEAPMAAVPERNEGVKDPMSHAAPVSAISPNAARLSFAGVTAFVVFVTALHFIKPELDPSWRFISEYAIGDYGWVMVLAFFSLALGFVTLFIAIRSQTRTIAGRIGLGFLLTSALGFAMAGAFTTDPITMSHPTLQGQLHSLGGTLAITIPFAVALVTFSLARNPAWSSARRSLLVTAGLAWIGFLVSVSSLVILFSRSNGAVGPDVPVGWPLRFELLTDCVWLMTVAWQAIQLRREPR